jgi:phenylpropionate dioxygenase-like ring-hydroxylating dioxygenase large terminal subunit
VTIHGRCAHMGANLANGRVADGRLLCPLHEWAYGEDGRCVRIPVADQIPAFARQATFPTVEIGGHVAFFNRAVAMFDFPFFEGKHVSDLLPSRPFDLVGNLPWYMIGANAFDFQHFRVAHDRTLVDTPVVTSPSPFARRITATYEVTGRSARDRFTRAFSGPRVRMTVTVWAGTLILVTAEFCRTTTYGMVFVRPRADGGAHMRTIVWIPRRCRAWSRALLDPLDAAIRRRFIRAFLTEDAVRTDGVRYNPATLIDADREMRAYLDWLATVVGGGETGSALAGAERKELTCHDTCSSGSSQSRS